VPVEGTVPVMEYVVWANRAPLASGLAGAARRGVHWPPPLSARGCGWRRAGWDGHDAHIGPEASSTHMGAPEVR